VRAQLGAEWKSLWFHLLTFYVFIGADGLAIGASYAAQKHVPTSLTSVLTSRGGLASLSILCHEIPHELGDFCSLIRAGYSKRQAITAQFLTAIAAFVGTGVALSVAEGWGSDTLLLVTAGGFVYLAATTILPEILDDSQSTAWFRLAQVACFCVGIGFLYVVTLLEDDDHHDGHHHHHGHSHHDHPHSEL
jgi:solute carrier family 39 (zinc transporter), member 7